MGIKINYQKKLELEKKPPKTNYCPWCGQELIKGHCPNKWCAYIIDDVFWVDKNNKYKSDY